FCLQSGQQPAQRCFIWEHDPDNGTAIYALMRIRPSSVTTARSISQTANAGYPAGQKRKPRRSGAGTKRQTLSNPLRRRSLGGCTGADFRKKQKEKSNRKTSLSFSMFSCEGNEAS